MKRTAAVALLGLLACTQDPSTGNDEDAGGGHGTHRDAGTLPRGSSSSGGGASTVGASSSSSSSGGISTGGSQDGSSGPSSSSGPQERPAYIYAHSPSVLYLLDADTLEVTELGFFVWENEDGTPTSDQMTDLAIDSMGRMYGVSFDALYRINPNALVARKVASLSGSYNGLTFVPAGMLDPVEEVLVGANNSTGNLYRIDLTTGQATQFGSYAGSWITSGDIVAIEGDGMYATVRPTVGTGDRLARIDPATGTATVMSATVGTSQLWGLGYWAGVLYGFSSTGAITSIDRTTGIGTVVHTQEQPFWGAGVTTVAKLPN